MRTIHRWFRSGSYSLLGHVDRLDEQSSRQGLLMVPPFGWEDVCSYRPLRFLAQRIAESGVPVLRFDLPGTGDSSGDALDPGLFDAWVRSIDDAADELRDVASVEQVTIMGVRLGAMLAAVAASRQCGSGSRLSDVILWGPSATGRTTLRELRAFASLERTDYAEGDTSNSQAVPGLDIGGFRITPETRAAVESIELSALPNLAERHVLVLSRDDGAPDSKSIRALEASGCQVQTARGREYQAMMAVPHDAVPPLGTAHAITGFLANINKEHVGSLPSGLRETGVSREAQGSETIYCVDHSSGSIFGILSQPMRASESCVLFLNSGAVRHTGPNRMWVEAARRWAKRGIASLRVDLNGVGESGGEPTPRTEGLYRDEMVEQVEVVMDSLRVRLGVQHFAAVGLCSGAFWAFQAAIRRPDICAAILLNPRLFFWDPEVDRRRLLKRTVQGLGRWTDWCRLARGDVKLESIKQMARTALERLRTAKAANGRQIPREAMSDAWTRIERNQTRVSLVFSEGEPLLREMEAEDQMPPAACSHVRCIRLPNCGHTFRPLWAQDLAHEVIDRELSESLLHTPMNASGPAFTAIR